MIGHHRTSSTTGTKGRFPFRLGAPSWVVPGDLAFNVNRLAALVDDVQLLFFESAGARGLAHDLDLTLLRDQADQHDLTYTVHLPTDIHLADRAPRTRQQGIEEIVRLVEKTAPLAPSALDLHLTGGDPSTHGWRDRLSDSLSRLAAALGPEWSRRLAVENIGYPIDMVQDLVRAHGLAFCLDFGHVAHYGHDWESARQLLPEAIHLHYHGLADGKDHRALTVAMGPFTRQLLTDLRQSSYTGVLTLEIYHLEQFITSACLLAEADEEHPEV
jgi:sugar phosphate isomerase/epimerase